MSCTGCGGSSSTPGCTYNPQTPTESSCSGTGSGDVTQLSAIWANTNCTSVYSNILYTSEGDVLKYNPCNLARVQADTNNLFETYLGYGFDFTSNVNSVKYNPFQEEIIDMCSNPTVPGACDLFLTNYCATYTRDQIQTDSALVSLCGCYVPPLYPTDTVSVPCDPLCHMVDTTQKADPVTGTITRCSNTVCVIDEVNIELVNTSASPAFTQICPNCTPSNPCTCIIGGTDPVTTLNDAGVGVTYLQYCGPNATCYTEDTSGNLTQVVCPTVDDFNVSAPSFTIPYILIIAAIVIVVILIVVFIATRYDKHYVKLEGDTVASVSSEKPGDLSTEDMTPVATGTVYMED